MEVELFIEVFEHFGPQGRPAIRISKFLSKKEDVQYILKQALSEKPITAKITLRNKMLAVPRLARIGLIDPTKL
ncbi:MAG: hypothetical protein MUP17_05015 [candidate division Zixibacteria bacterium]|nr:hypothetical protein [candidate division Zixibacteria bacterium]